MTKRQIRQRIAEILADERLSYSPANIFNNAPLALVQVTLRTELHTLQRVLGVEPTNVETIRIG